MHLDQEERKTVLVVEDDPIIRLSAVEMIRQLGFEAQHAGTAAQALLMLEKQSDIDVVFTDVAMPGSLDGLRLAHLIETRWPEISLVVTSGQRLVGEQDVPKSGTFIAKPYTLGVIGDALEQAANR